MTRKGILILIAIFSLFFDFNPALAFPDPIPQPLHPKVLIIGAGISGLAAANALEKNHIPVLVLEARNRIGGRIFTTYPWGSGLELGASWIHGIINNPIADLAAQKKLRWVPTDYSDQEGLGRFKSFVFYNKQGKELPQVESEQLIRLADEFEKTLVLHPDSQADTSVETELLHFIQQKHLDKPTSELLYYVAMLVYTHEHAADLNSLSVNFTHVTDRSRVSGTNVLLPSGYKEILPALAKEVPIALNQKVEKISYGPHGVEVYTSTKHYHADYVIVTVPLGVLKAGAIEFSPALPLNKQASIQKMRMGVYDKVYLLFDKPFWDKESEWIGYAPENPKNTIDIMNYYKINKTPVLLFFTAGSLAERMESWSDKKIVASMMKILRKIYGPAIPDPISYTITRWNQDPYAHGSYSYLPSGEGFQHYQVLAEPILNRLFFAGEATSATDPATVHGAYQTGLRAANEVAQAITEEAYSRLQRQLLATSHS